MSPGRSRATSKALRIREVLLAASPDDVQNRRDVALSYRKLGGQLTGTGDAARGIEYLRKGIAVQEQLAADQPDSLDIRQELGATYNLLGMALEGFGNIGVALDIPPQGAGGARIPGRRRAGKPEVPAWTRDHADQRWTRAGHERRLPGSHRGQPPGAPDR
jgi:hypothetical protein